MSTLDLVVDIVKVDALARRKNSKRHFLKDIENCFHEVTSIGAEPTKGWGTVFDAEKCIFRLE